MAMCVEDRVSNFPDHIRCHILSFLPIKAAVRTSIISTKWRYLFASISTIEFDRYLLRGLTDRNVDSFKNFVDRLLKFPDQVSLDCFRLTDGISSWNDEDHDFDVSGWICAALCRGVKEIDLQLDNLGDAPSVLFTCHSLQISRLARQVCTESVSFSYSTNTLEGKGSKLEVPPDVCLGNLKTLWLEHWVLFGDSINRLISNCHVLEDLAFTDCSVANTSELTIQSPSLKQLILDFFSEDVGGFNYVLVINAPNLVYFRYYSKIVNGYTLSNMDSLENADIRIDAFDFEGDETRICNVRSLTLVIDGLIPPTSPFPMFDNLIEFNFYGRETWLVEFLYCAPNLKTLKFSFSDVVGTRWKTLLTEVPSCLLFHLKEIEMQISYSERKPATNYCSY
ncbi:hypothetical protein GOBAR_AA17176 [Gossypium barbadense]|uniref:Uncharacterized protein n=1 Tax=Gossypium barbadense TaxID=3634 RepID=A0A2P5XJE8_GOSBA|nr:hypothetical protein GOBAR_AA17176 [Gossypium barbadense]